MGTAQCLPQRGHGYRPVQPPGVVGARGVPDPIPTSALQGTDELFQELAGIALSPGHPPARRPWPLPTWRRRWRPSTTHSSPRGRSCRRDRRARERRSALAARAQHRGADGPLPWRAGAWPRVGLRTLSVPPCLLQCPSCELTAIAETIPSQQWATDRSALLWVANAQVNADRAQGLTMLPAGAVERLQDCYDAILTAAEATNPRRPRRPSTRRARSSDPPPTTSSTACGNTAMRSCASSPICASPSTIIRPNATSVCPSSSRRFPVVSAPRPGSTPSP